MDRWKTELRAGVSKASDLDSLPRTPAETDREREVAAAYKVRIPAPYLARIDWDDPEDPIRLQVLPRGAELDVDSRESTDPIGDLAHSPVPRLTHRYPDRALLYPTYQCAVYCRHCFRKESLNDGNRGFSARALEPALAYVAAHPELREIILTGGDPLLLADREVRWIRERLEAIPHLRLLRVHTRIPVVLPSRVTAGLVEALEGSRMVVVVTHFNHPREITAEAEEACRRLRKAGFVLLNQSVLLRGVNDDTDTLEELFRELVYRLGARPYYLHHCDLTPGLTHFRTTIDAGMAIMRELRGRLSGVCQPTYVLDLPGGHGKVPLGPNWVEGREAHRWLFADWNGETHPYEEVVPETR